MTDRPATTVVGAEVDGVLTDVRIEDDVVEAVGTDLPRSGTTVVRAHGGALLRGLHDHHLHLLSMAARADSVDVGEAADPASFDAHLRAANAGAPPDAWLRVVGHDERHGPLDVARLDRLAPHRPVRVQHRTGGAWMLNTAAAGPARRPAGTWLHRDDEELRASWPARPPELGPTSGELAARGVTGVTDATPFDDAEGFAVLASARADGTLRQRVTVTGGPRLVGVASPAGVDRGPVKVVVGDHDLPDPAQLAATFAAAHAAGRPVAVHCVTRVALVLALVAWESAGSAPGDRIEHGSVIPLEVVPRIAELGLVVVTQPGFVRARGDRYLADVDPDDVEHLYRCGSLVAAGVGVAMSTDAPFGPADPWVAIATAADRRTVSGVVLGRDERIPARRALEGFLSPPEDPGGPPRRVERGAPADLCLLTAPLDRALAEVADDPAALGVAATWIAGDLVHGVH